MYMFTLFPIKNLLPMYFYSKALLAKSVKKGNTIIKQDA